MGIAKVELSLPRASMDEREISLGQVSPCLAKGQYGLRDPFKGTTTTHLTMEVCLRHPDTGSTAGGGADMIIMMAHVFNITVEHASGLASVMGPIGEASADNEADGCYVSYLFPGETEPLYTTVSWPFV